MKRIVVFLFAGLLLTGAVRAEKVLPETAATVAHNFMERQGAKAQLTLMDCGVGEMYLFAATDGGFVLVAGDDCARPILAYSLTSRFADTLPEHIASWLQGYAEEIALLRSRGEQASALVRDEWGTLLKADEQGPLYAVNVAPLLTTTWKQGSPYNTLCPTDTLNRKTISGCVAIAMAQVMKYWNHPTQGAGSYSYTTANCGTMSANFGATTYDWANMSNSLTSVSPTVNINAVATLVYHAGVSVKMSYGFSSSGATTVSSNNLSTITGERALRTYFKYDKALHSVQRDVVGDSVFTALLEGELLAGRPVIFSGHDSSGGHAFVCDGGNNAGLYHFNWGWGGYCDGYYQIGALNPAPGGAGGNATSHYNLDNKMIIGIQPDTVFAGNYTLTAVPDNASHGSVTGGESYAYGDTVELTALASSGYRFARWDDGMCYNSRNLIMGGDRTVTAVYDSVCGDTLRYDNGFYVTSWGYSTARSYYWAMKLEPALLAGHTHLDAVQAYFKEGGTYWVFVCNGTVPGDANMLDSLTYVSTEEGWATLSFDSALSINSTLPIWIGLYNDDITYPACAGVYCGHHQAAYSNTNGTNWAPSSTKRTFLIRGIFHTSEVTHQLVVQVDDSTAGTVSGSGIYPEGTYVEIAATAAPCYLFSHWSDGVTENPRVVAVSRDTAFTAYFDTVVYHTTQEEVACDSFLWVDGVIYTESVDGEEIMLFSIEGCDSIVMLTLTLGYSSFDTVVVDTTEAIVWEGMTCSESGVYSQTYQTAEGCDSVKVLLLTIQEPPVGIGVPDVVGGGIYPNPTEGVVHLRLEGVTEVEVYDLVGRRMAYFATGQTVDLGDLPDGTYLLRVKRPQDSATYRVVKR